jgi:hypothetical protein
MTHPHTAPRYRIELHVPGTGILDVYYVQDPADIRDALILLLQRQWLVINPGNVIKVVDLEAKA